MAYNYFRDDDIQRNVPEEHRRRVRYLVNTRFQLRDVMDPFAVSLPAFTEKFRLPQHLVFELIDLIRPHMPRKRRIDSLPLYIEVLVTLSFYAKGSYQSLVGDSAFDMVCQASVSNCIEHVTSALNHPDILTRLIRFPLTPAEREREIAVNGNLTLPRVLGLVDGTLVKIVPPVKNDDRRAYFCRKGYFALNVQVVCSSDLLILDINSRFAGATNDPYIYTASGLRDVMKQAYEESRCWLLGDSIYPHEPWLHTPMPEAEPGTPAYLYTKAHCKDRNPVERCIGVLKERWRCLHWDRTLHYTPQKAGAIVNACAVLHNFCMLRKIPDPVVPRRRPENDDASYVQEVEDVNSDEEMEDGGNIDGRGAAALRRRRQLAQQERLFLINHVVQRQGGQ